MIEQIVETWHINNRINLHLIKHISREGMLSTLSKRGGRNVVRQFAHIHNNRIWQLEGRAKTLAKGARKFETHDEPDRRTLMKALEDSAQRIETMLRQANKDVRGVRTFRRGLVPYVAYFVAHESHHRGNILLTLKQCGHALDTAKRSAIWDWDRI